MNRASEIQVAYRKRRAERDPEWAEYRRQLGVLFMRRSRARKAVAKATERLAEAEAAIVALKASRSEAVR